MPASKKKTSEKKSTLRSKKLTRSTTNRVIAGVAGGLAEYFEVDATIIRLIFVLLTVFGGSGVIIYIVLWLIIPHDKYHGEITEESIKAGADEMRDTAKKFAGEMKTYSKTNDSKYIFGVIIILLGIFFLLSNFGVMRFLNLARLWPVILVILGILILSRER